MKKELSIKLLTSIFLVLVMVLTLFVACTPAPTPTPTPTPTAKPTATPTPTPTAKPTATPTATPTPTAAWVPVWKDGKLQPLADGFPNAPITVWTAWGPGHAEEIYARALFANVSNFSPVPFSFQPGNIGARIWWGLLDKFETLPRVKEGYQIASLNIGAHAGTYWTQPRGKWKTEDVNVIAATEDIYNILAVSGTSPWKTVEDLVAYAKANPGKVRYAASAGSFAHLNGIYLAQQLGMQALLVPHSSAPQGMLSLIGGGVEFTSYTVGTTVAFKDQIKMLLTLTDGPRPGAFADIPTSKEKNLKIFGSYRGIVTFPGVPQSHIDWIYELIKKMMEQQPYHDYLIASGTQRILRDGKDIQAELKKNTEMLGPIIKELGLAVEQK